MIAAVLIPILAEIGAPILKRLLADKLPGLGGEVAGTVVDTVATKLGVPKTPEAIADAYRKNPAAVSVAVREIEATFGDAWLEQSLSSRDALFDREDAKGFFAWGWRPALSWLLIWLWMWDCFLLPVINTAVDGTIPPVPYETLIAFTGLWLTIYGGGHTIKSVFGK